MEEKNLLENQRLMLKDKIEAIVIGGSAGSLSVVGNILARLDKQMNLPIILCLHRLVEVRNGYVETLSAKSKRPVVEPLDKESIQNGMVYLAPANYHLYVKKAIISRFLPKKW
jgi:two-component system, chemotaxis family, protein-glutamate methylesterase/glutaminase